ncbi:MAG: serine/threonine-protein kinase, partial [Desulfatitalea sp.]
MEPTGRIFTDTSDYYEIGPGDEIQVGGRSFLVTGEEREYRFGIEDPKFWVKKVIERDTQERKILKLSFAESFMTYLGSVPVHCFRDPAKEAAILKLVAGRPEFMQGSAYADSRGNIVRVLDIVRGINFLNHVVEFRMPHEIYFQTKLPGILRRLIPAIDAIGFLHQHGFRHGDLRNDHVYVTHEDGRYVWIDFDYDF